MNKSELIDALAARYEGNRKQAAHALESVLDTITREVAKGEKVAITSTVPNTTRRRIFGVANGEDWQLVLVDLPGFQRPMDALTEKMQETVDGSFEDVDVVLGPVLAGIVAVAALAARGRG